MLVSKPVMTARHSAAEIFLIFLRLGCSSFGGPVAHIGYFRAEFVERRHWVSDASFAEILALAQSMPGPASSQVGFALGLLRGGVWGGCAAWLGFTLPSAFLMLAFAVGHDLFAGRIPQAVLHGLQLVAVAVVAQAVVAMQRSLAPDLQRVSLAIVAMAIVLWAPAALGTDFAIAFGLLAGLLVLKTTERTAWEGFSERISKGTQSFAGILFAGLLLVSFLFPSNSIRFTTVFARFYRAGALVFGGGHVVLPLLDQATVATHWISADAFLSGYGAAQALPGPLFAFSAYLGAAIGPSTHPLLFGVEALIAIFLPGLLLMTVMLPYWSSLRERRTVLVGLQGVNASVVGVLMAALYRPVWLSTVHSGLDLGIALSAFLLLTWGKLRPWILVLGVGAFCGLFAAIRG